MDFIWLFAAIFGLIVGSFINAAVYRLHASRPGLWLGRSYCPQCRHTLAASDLVPLFSYLWLRGRCRYCHRGIGWHYPLVELATATFWGITAWQLGWQQPAVLIAQLVLVAVLVFLASFDWLYGQISDQVSLPALALTILGAPWLSGLTYIQSALGLACGGGFFLVLVLVSRGRWMGGGDIRLGALLGALLGWQLVLLSIFLASLLGSLVGAYLIWRARYGFSSAIPFAPALTLAGWLCWLWGEQFLSWYLQFSSL